MIKKVIIIVVLILSIVTLSSCSLAVDREPIVKNPLDEVINQALLKGYVISFRSYDEGIEFDMGLDAENPFMVYEHENFTHEISYREYIQGNAIFMPLIKENITDESRSIELETYIILGPKFINSIIDVQQVLQDQETKEMMIESYTYGHMISNMSIGIKLFLESEHKENEILIYSFKFGIEIKFVDTLLSVNVLEYDQDNVLLKSTIYDAYGQYNLNSLANTDYVIIEEKYQKQDGEIYIQRVIYSRGDSYSNTHIIPLMFTNEIGFVENNKYIQLIFI